MHVRLCSECTLQSGCAAAGTTCALDEATKLVCLNTEPGYYHVSRGVVACADGSFTLGDGPCLGPSSLAMCVFRPVSVLRSHQHVRGQPYGRSLFLVL